VYILVVEPRNSETHSLKVWKDLMNWDQLALGPGAKGVDGRAQRGSGGEVMQVESAGPRPPSTAWCNVSTGHSMYILFASLCSGNWVSHCGVSQFPEVGLGR